MTEAIDDSEDPRISLDAIFGPSGPAARPEPRRRTVTRSDTVYETIRDALKTGRYPTGTRLIEGNVAAAMHVSRTPVREALRRLEGDGLIRVGSSGRGYVVADLSADVEHVFLIRERLEGLGAWLAAQHITSAELRTLGDLQTEMEELLAAEGDIRSAMAELNSRFHSLIMSAALSPRLEKLVARLNPEYLSYQVVLRYDEEEMEQSINEHRAINEALFNRDAGLADRLVQAHFEHGKHVVLGELAKERGAPAPGQRASAGSNITG